MAIAALVFLLISMQQAGAQQNDFIFQIRAGVTLPGDVVPYAFSPGAMLGIAAGSRLGGRWAWTIGADVSAYLPSHDAIIQTLPAVFDDSASTTNFDPPIAAAVIGGTLDGYFLFNPTLDVGTAYLVAGPAAYYVVGREGTLSTTDASAEIVIPEVTSFSIGANGGIGVYAPIARGGMGLMAEFRYFAAFAGDVDGFEPVYGVFRVGVGF